MLRVAPSLENGTYAYSGRVTTTLSAASAYQGLHHREAGMSGNANERCRMCGKTSESVGHTLAGCSAIAPTQYLARHNKSSQSLVFLRC